MADIFREAFLGFIRVHLLHHAAQGRIFGVEMIHELGEHGYKLSPGTLYPILHAMEKAGYLRSEEEIAGGKLRKYYRATPSGRKALRELKKKIRELSDEIFESGPD